MDFLRFYYARIMEWKMRMAMYRRFEKGQRIKAIWWEGIHILAADPPPPAKEYLHPITVYRDYNKIKGAWFIPPCRSRIFSVLPTRAQISCAYPKTADDDFVAAAKALKSTIKKKGRWSGTFSSDV